MLYNIWYTVCRCVVWFNIMTGQLLVSEWYSELRGPCMATVLAYVLGHCTPDLRVSLLLVKPAPDNHVLTVAYVTSVTLMGHCDLMIGIGESVKTKGNKAVFHSLTFSLTSLVYSFQTGMVGRWSAFRIVVIKLSSTSCLTSIEAC